MNDAIDLKEVRPGVYGIPPKREPVLSPGWFGRIAYLAIVITLSQLVVSGIDYIGNAAVENATGKSVHYWTHAKPTR